MPMDLSSLLSETLTARGYEVEDAPPLEGASGATYPVSLLAGKDGEQLLVDVLATRGVTGRDVEALASIVDDTGVDGALLFAIGGVDDLEGADPSTDIVEVWERSALEGAIGDLILERALEGNLDLEDFEATTVSAADPEPQPDPEPETGWAEPELPDIPEADPAPASAGSEGGSVPENDDTEVLTDDTSPAARANGSAEPGPAAEASGPPADTPESPAAEPEPDPEPARAPDPEPQPDPQPDPEPATASGSDEPDPAADGGEFVSPEEMAKRAKEMLEKGEIPEDGDAELMTDDDGPDAGPGRGTREPAEPPESGPAPGGEPEGPEADPARASSPAEEPSPTTQADHGVEPTGTQPDDEDDELQEGQVFEDADCELLPSKPKSEREGTNDDPEPAAVDGEPAPDPEPEEISDSSGQPATPASPSQAADPPSPAAAGSSPAMAAGPPSADDETFLSGGVMDPEIDAEEAKHQAKEALFQVHEARLELLPFHVFEYSCVLEGGGNRRKEEGRLWVSAQSGGVVAEPDGFLVDDPGVPHERFQARLNPAKATREARDHLLDDLEVRDELREDFSETAVIERVTLSPRKDSLELAHLGKAFAPRWRVEGQNGTVFVDAITGDLVTG